MMIWSQHRMTEYYGLGEEIDEYRETDEKMIRVNIPKEISWTYLVSLICFPYVLMSWVYIYLHYLK
ncbi:hypothetical protein FDH01_gp161 [Acinetobacter phage vB_AbaM_ME3]|uniref:Putative membrane protein n=1 Tax=Acinetobacter phage vB_AbaM_ME3 TaxID=1837876 RepID=A0A172Q0T2_9CAUD|nr:hypothetical protein FDH01_gp161 [Acinetobacter phage vB_AbaM_ME3]AND75461.1 putative membrane protein [Acinetobacter phage vB_AbaM_ME3]